MEFVMVADNNRDRNYYTTFVFIIFCVVVLWMDKGVAILNTDQYIGLSYLVGVDKLKHSWF